jgi:TonB family protein
VIQASISKSTNNALDQSALAALQNWSFKPAKLDGKPVKTRVTVPIRFEESA